MNVSERTILVTGGSSGIGLAFAEAFLALGNTVIITGRTQAKLDAAKSAHPALHTFQCDAADPAQLEALSNWIDAEHPGLDMLFNNAGIIHFRNLGTRADDLVELTKEIDINLSGAIRTVSVLVERLRANKGAIVNVSTGLAFAPIQAAPVYCAAKAGLHSYTVSLRQQLAGDVEVIELMPPGVKTALFDDIPDDAGFEMITTEQLVETTIPALRKGTPEIRLGQANKLHWMSRIAPGFIHDQLAKSSAALVPKT